MLHHQAGLYLEYNKSMAETIGQKLQQIREAQGLSLDELSQRTHIKVPYLKALEEGNVEALPSQAHLRGFLRLYASELDVDLEQLISEVNQTIEQEKPQEESEETASQVEEPSQVPGKAALSIQDVKQRITGLFKKSQTPEDTKSDSSTMEASSEGLSTEPIDPRSSGEILSDIGKQLHQRRNLISLSLDDIESQTHIRKHFLSAIEAGHFDKLPSPVQARGMLANYAGFLSMDAEAILLDFADALQKKRLETVQLPPHKQAPREISPTRLRLKNFFSLDLLVIAAIFVVIAGFVIWGVNRIMTADSPVASSTDLPEVSDVLLATPSPTLEFIETIESSESNETTEEVTGVEITEIPTLQSNTSAIAIVVIPIQNAWIQVTSDDEIVYQGRVITGNAYDYYADQKLELLTGSAGAIQVFFNDQDIGSIGLIGQVSNLVFTTNGLVLPTATPSPTPTVTPQDSPTPSITPTPTSIDSENNDTGS